MQNVDFALKGTRLVDKPVRDEAGNVVKGKDGKVQTSKVPVPGPVKGRIIVGEDEVVIHDDLNAEVAKIVVVDGSLRVVEASEAKVEEEPKGKKGKKDQE